MKKRLFVFSFALALLLAFLCACDSGAKEGHPHPLMRVEAKEPTCGEEGNIAYYDCSCGKYFSDATGFEEIIDKTSVIIPKTEHPVRYEHNNTTHKKVVTCKHTDVVYENEAHTVGSNNVCSVCGYRIGTAGLEYVLTEDGEAYLVSGIGTATETQIIFPVSYLGKPVRGIAEKAFFGNTDIEAICIREGIESIGANAFKGCTGLVDIILPPDMTDIASNAFSECISIEMADMPTGAVPLIPKNSLTHVVINGGMSLDAYAFRSCTNLVSVSFFESVMDIGECAFLHCSSLETVELPENLMSIEYGIFMGCKSLNAITIPDGVTKIEDEAFSWCESLSFIVIPDSVKHVGMGAFSYCKSLSSVILNPGVTSIGSLAFYYCTDLLSLRIPDSVIRFGNDCFLACTSLSLLLYEGTVAQWVELDNELGLSPDCTVNCSDGVYSEDGVFEPDGSDELFTVTFKYVSPNGSLLSVKGQDNVTGSTVTVAWGEKAEDPVLGDLTAFEDYVIIGWDTDGDGMADSGLASVKKNMKATGVVRLKTALDVTLLGADGTEFTRLKVKEGNAIPKAVRPVEIGKYFKNWTLVSYGSDSTADFICDNCTFRAVYGVADGTIGKVASGAIELDGRRDEEYNTSGAYLPVNTMTQADGHYYDWTVKDVEHGGTRAVPNVAADTWIVWDGNYIYMIIEVADNTLTDRGAAYIAKGLDAWCNDGVELWYTFEQVFENGYNDTRVGIDSMGTATYALARSRGIGKGRSTHYDEIRYAVRNSLAGDTGSDLSRTGYADNAKTVRKASYIIEYRLPAWTEGQADVANYPNINKDTGLLAGRNPESNNKNDYAFTSGEKLVAGDVVRFNLQIDDLMILQAEKTGGEGKYYWDCPPDDKIPAFLYSNIMLYETDGHGNITGAADITGKFSACGHTNNYTQYYIMFTLGDTAEAKTKIWGLAGHPSGWEGVDTRKFYANKECTVEYIRP